MTDTEWYKKWFASERYLQVYRHRNSEDAERLLSLVERETELSAGAAVLDAACGAGRHSVILSERGYDVTAFDLSLPLLKIASAACKPEGIDFINADIRNFYVKKEFELVMNLFTSFGYFESDWDNFRFADSAYRMLKPGGFFVLDYLNADFTVENLVPRSERNDKGKNIVEERRISEGRVEKKITVEENGKKDTWYESVKLYSREFIEKEFIKLGYTLHKTFGDYHGRYFHKDSPRLVMIFTK